MIFIQKKILVLSLLITLFSLSYAEEAVTGDEDEKNEHSGPVYQAKKYRDILRMIDAYYYQELDIDSLSEATFKLMMQSLDNFSFYYDKEETTAQKGTDKGTLVSLGFNYLTVDKQPIVYEVFEGSPADSLGIKRGSIIKSIDGKSTIGDSIGQISELMNGEEGSEAMIILDYLGKPDTILMTRKGFVLSSLSSAFAIKKDEGLLVYLQISRFSDETTEECLAAIDNIISEYNAKEDDIMGFIVDLRGNAGGKLGEAREFSGLFLDKDMTVAKTKARSSKYVLELKTEERGRFYGTPVTVLVDNSSASASEIVAGVIQDHDLGVVVGEITFGKGIVQNTWDFNDSTAVRFTVASYSTPSGREVETRMSTDISELDESIFFGMSDEQQEILKEQLEIYGTKGRVETFRTSKGRVVFGLKGIKPDIEYEGNETTKMHQLINRKKLYFVSAYVYLKNNPDKLSELNSQGEQTYIVNYNVDPAYLATFKELAKSNSLWNDDMYAKDKDLMAEYLKSELARLVFKSRTSNNIISMSDPIVDNFDYYSNESLKILELEPSN